MRKYHQKLILDLIGTLRDANSDIKKLAKNDMQAMTNLLADCQDSAENIADFVNRLDVDGASVIVSLEEYCKILYQISLPENSENRKQLLEELRKQIYKIEIGIKTDLKPNKSEIVFFPYKASMWDSLESIWLAAKDDPQCDAYVVPIPYYDKNPDGSFGEMHYEGADYPDYVPITDWRQYDIEAHGPDAVFIHNPYDGNNYVTSVHPDFYAERLRKLTGMLVYVPYFVTVESIEEHFCVNAGTMYAHKVIVESEKIRSEYIRHIKDYEKKYKCVSCLGKLEDKIIALGSPKFDKVINTKREDCVLPESWKKLLGGKKAILYNTSVSSALKDSERYLKKLDSVFEVFRNREDVVLWWRPHPLLENTFASMRPALADEYGRIADEYRRAGFGIYDDTPDLHRAIACTDAYYGDLSSLVHMYGIKREPIMMQGTEIVEESERKIDPAFAFLYDDGEKFYFTSDAYNALFAMDKNTWEEEYVGSFPNESPCYIAMFRNPVKTGEKMFFIPLNANEICVYSEKENCFNKIPFKNMPGKWAFIGAVAYKRYVYFTPYMYPAIMRLDTITNEITYYSDWVKPLTNLSGYEKVSFFCAPCVLGEVIMLAANCVNAVVEFNMRTGDSVIHKIGKRDYRYMSACFDGENYWLLPQYNGLPVVKWNIKTGQIKEFDNLSYDDGKRIMHPFISLIYGGYIWLLPHTSKHAFKIDIVTDEVFIADEFEPENSEENESSRYIYYFAQVIGDSIFAYNKPKDTLIEYNFKTKTCREEPVHYSKEALEQLKVLHSCIFIRESENIKTIWDCCQWESAYIGLSDLINFVAYSDHPIIKNRKVMRPVNTFGDGKNGQAIYNCTKTQITGESTI